MWNRSPMTRVGRDRYSTVLTPRRACPEYVEGISSAHGWRMGRARMNYSIGRIGAGVGPTRSESCRLCHLILELNLEPSLLRGATAWRENSEPRAHSYQQEREKRANRTRVLRGTQDHHPRKRKEKRVKDRDRESLPPRQGFRCK